MALLFFFDLALRGIAVLGCLLVSPHVFLNHANYQLSCLLLDVSQAGRRGQLYHIFHVRVVGLFSHLLDAREIPRELPGRLGSRACHRLCEGSVFSVRQLTNKVNLLLLFWTYLLQVDEKLLPQS